MRRYTGPPVELPGYYTPPAPQVVKLEVQVTVAVRDTNTEPRSMDKPVKDLTGTIKEAMAALAGVGAAAQRLKSAALSVSDKVYTVNSLSSDLEGADAALGAMLGAAVEKTTSNGGPSGPLPGEVNTSPPSTPSSPTSPPATGPSPTLASPVVTAASPPVAPAASPPPPPSVSPSALPPAALTLRQAQKTVEGANA